MFTIPNPTYFKYNKRLADDHILACKQNYTVFIFLFVYKFSNFELWVFFSE